jgi:hypothetical protein
MDFLFATIVPAGMSSAARWELKQYLQQRRDALAADKAYAALQQQRKGLPAAASRMELLELLDTHQVRLEHALCSGDGCNVVKRMFHCHSRVHAWVAVHLPSS